MNYYVQISCSFKTRLKRCLAWAIDWNILGGIAMILVMLSRGIASVSGQELLLWAMVPIMIAWIILFILRDMVFGGTSIGKRIMKLKLVDKVTGCEASKKQKALRGVSLFLVSFDALFLLISGSSLGDRIASTAVVKSSFATPDGSAPIDNGYVIDEEGKTVPKKSNKKAIVIVIALIVAFIAALTVIITVVFGRVKKSEEYALAYDYLVSSMYFDYYNLSEDDVKLTGYSSTTYASDGVTRVEFTFKIGIRSVKVYCVKENGSWCVSETHSRLNTPNS